MDNDELKIDRRLDPEALDVDCVCQAELYSKWAMRHVRAKARADNLKWDMERLESQLQLQARKCPGDFGLEKDTEAAIKAAVKCSKEYGDAVRAYFDAEVEAAKLGRAVTAMEQRKRMLELLVKLHGDEYFAGPATPRQLPAEFRKRQELADYNNTRQRRVKRER